MSNLTLLDRKLVGAASASGGSWSGSLPLSNMFDGAPKKIARSTDLVAENTSFVVDHGRAIPMSTFAFINNNYSPTSTLRIRASNSSDGSSALIDVTIPGRMPDVPYGSLAWGDMPWNGISGRIPSGGLITYYQHSSLVLARYSVVNITDTANADGYVQTGPFLAGYGFTTTINMAWGAGIEFIDESELSRAIAGDLYVDERPKRRRMSGQLQFLTADEGIGRAFDINDINGITRGILAIYDPDDESGVKPRRTIYGTLTSLSPITDERPGDYQQSWSMQLEELN